MNLKCYLVVDKHGALKVLKVRPLLAPDGISIQLNLEIPDALFHRPRIEATLVVKESAVTPPIIEAETVGVVRQAIQNSTGLDVRISIAEEGSP